MFYRCIPCEWLFTTSLIPKQSIGHDRALLCIPYMVYNPQRYAYLPEDKKENEKGYDDYVATKNQPSLQKT